MKNGLNRTELIGNVGADATIGQTNGGNAVCNFSLAVNKTWKDNDGNDKEKTTWYKVSIFGKRATNLQPYITSGITLFLAGEVGAESWNGEDGKAKHGLTIKIGQNNADFMFLGGGNRDGVPNTEDESLFVDENEEVLG